MVYDSARRRTVLFGGQTYVGSWWVWLNQTWEYDGSTWIQRSPAVSPPARVNHRMAYDSARRRVVLFGGVGLAGEVNDTWEWDGNNWMQRNPARSPPSRSRHAMAYDPVRQRTVLFGGLNSYAPLPQFPFGGTWEWDGSDWMEFTGGAAPIPRVGHAMAFDSRNRGVFLVSGGAPGTTLTDTWTWGNPPLAGTGSGAGGHDREPHLHLSERSRPAVPRRVFVRDGTDPARRRPVDRSQPRSLVRGIRSSARHRGSSPGITVTSTRAGKRLP